MLRVAARMDPGWRTIQVAGAVLLLTCFALVLFAGRATATTGPCGTLSSGDGVYIDCVVPPASSPYTTYTDGEQVNMSMGPNSVFSPSDANGGDIEAIECEYNNGNGGPGDPPNDNYCSAQTIGPDFPFAVAPSGAFDYAGQNEGDLMAVYALPDTKYPTATITCNTTDPCVWYVGEDYGNFAAPHVFSNPFYVSGGVTTTTTTPATSTTTSPSTTTSTTTSVPATTTTTAAGGGTTTTTTAGGATTTSTTSGSSSAGSAGSGSSGSSPGSSQVSASSGELAFTGQSPLLVWMMAFGFLMMIVGTLGRAMVAKRVT